MGDDNDNPVINPRLDVNEKVWTLSTGDGKYYYEYGEGLEVIDKGEKVVNWNNEDSESDDNRDTLFDMRAEKIDELGKKYPKSRTNADLSVDFWKPSSRDTNYVAYVTKIKQK